MATLQLKARLWQQRLGKNPREHPVFCSRTPGRIQGADPLELPMGPNTAQPGTIVLQPGGEMRVAFSQECLLLLLDLPQVKGTPG